MPLYDERDISECAETLHDSVAFRQLTDAQIRALARTADKRVFRYNEEIHHEGTPQVRRRPAARAHAHKLCTDRRRCTRWRTGT